MKPNWRTEWPCWLLLAGMFVLAAITWSGAPDRIPVHWGLQGNQPDRYGGRFEGLLGIPLLSLVLYALFLGLPAIDPGRLNYPRFAGAYLTFRIGLLAFMAVIYGFIHLWIRGVEVDLVRAMPLLMGALFVVIGNLFGKLRPNWFVGIRTPWTLSSKVAWTQSHRLGGWLFVATGILLLATGALGSPRLFLGILVLFGVGLIAVMVRSYFLWRSDPDKTPPAGTSPADG